MKDIKIKSLLLFVFIPLLFLIFCRAFFSGLTYPILENYYQNSIIFLAIISMFFNRAIRIKNSYTIPIILLLLAYLVSGIGSINIQNSIKEIIKFVSYLCIFFLVSQGNDKEKKIIVKTIVISGLIISVYSIYQYFWGYHHTLDYLKKINSEFLLGSSYARDILIAKRAIGTFPSPNLFGGYLIIVFFLSLSLIKNDIGVKIWYLAPFLIIIALILTKSMGVWLSLIIGVLILFFLSYESFKKQRLIFAIFSIFICIVLTFIILNRWDRLINLENPQNSITQRLNYWRTAIAIIKEHPIVGIGPGNFQEVFLNYKVGLSTNTRYAHNILLHQWAETGLLGFMALLYLIVVFLKKFKLKSKNTSILLGGLAFLLHNLIDNTYFIPQTGFFLWILLALI